MVATHTDVGRARLIAVAVLALVLVAAGGVAYLVLRPAAPAMSSTKDASPHPALTGGQAAKLATDTTSGQEGTVGDAVVLPAGQPLDDGAVAALADLEPLNIDAASFKDRGDGTATVNATAGADVTAWIVTLNWDSGRWKMATTQPAGRP